MPCLLPLLAHLLPVCQHIFQDPLSFECFILLEWAQLRPQLLQELHMCLKGQTTQAGLGLDVQGLGSGLGLRACFSLAS